MAFIQGISSGFVPEVKYVAAPKKKAVNSSIITCDSCGANYTHKSRDYNSLHETTCNECIKFFGDPYDSSVRGSGVTNISVKDAIERIEKVAESKYVILLKTQNFVTFEGLEFTVEFGDIFPLKRASLALLDKQELPSRERTKALFTIEISVGGNALTLYPHEYGSVNFLEIMELRRDGEYIESFVSSDDNEGYFTPTPEIKQMLKNQFHR